MKNLHSASMLRLAVRIVLYAVALAGVSHLMIMEAYQVHVGSLCGENSAAEWMQVIFIFLSITALTWAGALDRTKRPLTILVAGLLLVLGIREFDGVLDKYVFDGAWQLAVTGTLVLITLLVYRQTQPLGPAIRDFVNRASFGIMLSGFLTIFVFAQSFGQQVFWRAVMGEHYLRSVKNVAEEGSELLGYFLLLIGAIEYLQTCYMRLKAEDLVNEENCPDIRQEGL